MSIINNSNKIFNKQFLSTLMISEFIILVDYTFFYLRNQNAIGSFNLLISFDLFIQGFLIIFFTLIFLLIFVKLIISKIFPFISIGLFLLTLYAPLIGLSTYPDALIKLLALGAIFLTWIILSYAFRNEDSNKIIKNSFFVSLIFFSTSLLEFIYLNSGTKLANEQSFELLKRSESPVKINFDSQLELPNIIYIVPDRYGGINQLKKYLNYDNSSFLNALKDRGFIIGKDSRSNYPETYASILSTLNSSYIIEPNDIKKTKDWAYPAITNSHAYSNLHDLGYKLYNVNNWWEGTRFISNEEFNFYSEYIAPEKNLLSYYLKEKTPFASILRKLSESLFNKPSNLFIDIRFRCDIQKNQFKQLSNLTQVKNNGIFAFAHFIIPHPPYMLNASGECDKTTIHYTFPDKEINKTKYIESLKFFNDQILNTFDEMLKTNKNFIFIIQSDEGPKPCFYEDQCDDNWDLKTSNINAFYASNKLKIDENDLKTPINNFIYIYEYLLDIDIEKLDDIVYKGKIMTDNQPFDFKEIDNFEIAN